MDVLFRILYWIKVIGPFLPQVTVGGGYRGYSGEVTVLGDMHAQDDTQGIVAAIGENARGREKIAFVSGNFPSSTQATVGYLTSQPVVAIFWS